MLHPKESTQGGKLFVDILKEGTPMWDINLSSYLALLRGGQTKNMS
jgi:hypothetical protein